MLSGTARFFRGSKLRGRLFEMDHVRKCFDSSSITCMACGGKATILLYEEGTWAFTSGLPKYLQNKLWGRQRWLPSPEYVSLGSEDRYYIRFQDGKSQWVGCDLLTESLKMDNETCYDVASVAFGSDWDSFFIVYKDGGYNYFNVPDALIDLEETRRQARTDLDCVSLGPAGEWFLRAKNGRMWWNSMSHESMDEIAAHQHQVTFMDFGDGGAYLLLVEDGDDDLVEYDNSCAESGYSWVDYDDDDE